MGKKKLSVFGMPVEIRDYIPIDTIALVTKKGQRLTVTNKTTGSETIYETPPEIKIIKLAQAQSGETK